MRGAHPHILTLFCFARSLFLSLRYDRWAANWLWLPLRCCRPRPPFWLYYPMRPAEEGEEPDEPEDNLVPPGICGVQGCPLPDGHLGLCQVKICSSRRQSVQEKTIIQEQMAR